MTTPKKQMLIDLMIRIRPYLSRLECRRPEREERGDLERERRRRSRLSRLRERLLSNKKMRFAVKLYLPSVTVRSVMLFFIFAFGRSAFFNCFLKITNKLGFNALKFTFISSYFSRIETIPRCIFPLK